MEPTIDELNKSLNKLMSEPSTPLPPDPRETAPEIKNSIAQSMRNAALLALEKYKNSFDAGIWKTPQNSPEAVNAITDRLGRTNLSEKVDGLQIEVFTEKNLMLSVEVYDEAHLDKAYVHGAKPIPDSDVELKLIQTNSRGEVVGFAQQHSIFERMEMSRDELAQLVTERLKGMINKIDLQSAVQPEEIQNYSVPIVNESSETDLLPEVSTTISVETEKVELVQAESVVDNNSTAWGEALKSELDKLSGSKIQVFSGANKVYEQVDKVITLNKLKTSFGGKIQQGLESPNDLKGSVRILVDGENVYHAKDGAVLKNTHDLKLENDGVSQSENLDVTEFTQTIEVLNQERGAKFQDNTDALGQGESNDDFILYIPDNTAYGKLTSDERTLVGETHLLHDRVSKILNKQKYLNLGDKNNKLGEFEFKYDYEKNSLLMNKNSNLVFQTIDGNATEINKSNFSKNITEVSELIYSVENEVVINENNLVSISSEQNVNGSTLPKIDLESNVITDSLFPQIAPFEALPQNQNSNEQVNITDLEQASENQQVSQDRNSQSVLLKQKENTIPQPSTRQNEQIDLLEQKLAAQTQPLNSKVNQWLGALNQIAKGVVKEVKEKSLQVVNNSRTSLTQGSENLGDSKVDPAVVAEREVNKLSNGKTKQFLKSFLQQASQKSQQVVGGVNAINQFRRNREVANTAISLLDHHYQQTQEHSYQAEGYKISLEGKNTYVISDRSERELMKIKVGGVLGPKVVSNQMNKFNYLDFDRAHKQIQQLGIDGLSNQPHQRVKQLGSLAIQGDSELINAIKTQQVKQIAVNFLHSTGISSWDAGDKGNYSIESTGDDNLEIRSTKDNRGTILKLSDGKLESNLEAKDFAYFQQLKNYSQVSESYSYSPAKPPLRSPVVNDLANSNLRNLASLITAKNVLDTFNLKAYESESFRFERQNDVVIVKAKDGRGEIARMQNGQATGRVSDRDVIHFSSLNQMLNSTSRSNSVLVDLAETKQTNTNPSSSKSSYTKLSSGIEME